MASLLNMSRGSLRSLDWAGLAKALIDPTIPFDITGFEVNPVSNVLYFKSNLTGTLTIKSGATTVGASAFYNCIGITGVIIPDGVTSISSSAFNHCTNLTSIMIPNGVTIIGSNAFAYCSSLTSVTIPNSVTSIGTQAFFDCTNLTSITIPDSVTSIGTSAFSGCTKLTSITIPNSVTGISAGAFFSCTSLVTVTVEASTPPTIGINVFSDNYVLEAIYVPDASVNAYKTANNWSTYESYIKPISERVV